MPLITYPNISSPWTVRRTQIFKIQVSGVKREEARCSGGLRINSDPLGTYFRPGPIGNKLAKP